ncbi:hypothetical protein Tco_0468244 [Tanacetum coccineum]
MNRNQASRIKLNNDRNLTIPVAAQKLDVEGIGWEGLEHSNRVLRVEKDSLCDYFMFRKAESVILSVSSPNEPKSRVFPPNAIQEPLHPLPKLLGVGPNDSLKDEISLADLTLTPTISDEIKKVPDKRSAVNVLKKKAQPATSTVPDRSLAKKAESSTEKLLLTMIEEVKGLKEQIKIPLDTSPSVSQSESSKSAKGKQKTWFGPCKHRGFRNYLSKDCYMKRTCSTRGFTNHMTKEHLE